MKATLKAAHHIVVVVIVLAVTDCCTFAQSKLLLGYSSLSSNQTPVWVAKEEGFYKRFGVDADLILIEGSTRGRAGLDIRRSTNYRHGRAGHHQCAGARR